MSSNNGNSWRFNKKKIWKNPNTINENKNNDEKKQKIEKDTKNPNINQKIEEKKPNIEKKSNIFKDPRKRRESDEDELLKTLKNILDDPNAKEITISRIELPTAAATMDKQPQMDKGFGAFLAHLLEQNEKENNSNSKKSNNKPPAFAEFNIDPEKTYDEVTKKITSLDDLIELGKSYDEKINHNYPFNLKRLNMIVPSLEKLKNVIGMDQPKKNIIYQIMYFLSGIEKNENMLHTAILGSPGSGKTMLGHIIGEIYYKLGIINGSSDKDEFPFVIAKRDDMIGEYVGHTAPKTRKMINKAKGGILFLDEVYQFGSDEKRDTFSKECIDTLNQSLTENRGDFICIVAGYPDQVDKCFFGINEGLQRRFPFIYIIDKYTDEELAKILISMSKDWSILPSLKELTSFISSNRNTFPNLGGDMETLLFNIKIAHSLRVFGIQPINRKKITMDDIKAGLELFVKTKRNENKADIPLGMYN